MKDNIKEAGFLASLLTVTYDDNVAGFPLEYFSFPVSVHSTNAQYS
jgi:hypothetical protein